MLLLDEPTTTWDADSVAWLEHFLHDFPGTVVAITTIVTSLITSLLDSGNGPVATACPFEGKLLA